MIAAQVIRNAGAFNDGLRSEGILSCGKHFPGYSRAPLDAHHELPVIDLSRADLEAHELAVFRHFADRIDSMMIGHAFYPALDDTGVPSSLSRRVITDLLRGEHGFRGLVMTDDLDMGAILEPFGKDDSGLARVIQLAITAGNDVAMICHRVDMVERAHGFLEKVAARRTRSRAGECRGFQTADGETRSVGRGGIPPTRCGSVGSARGDARCGAGGAAQPRGWQALAGRDVLADRRKS